MSAFVPVTPGQVTIAITVFNRRQYIRRAVASSLEQTKPVRVIVVEDCGPDPTLQEFVKSEFGNRIEYFRNPVRRGLFGNWNSCLEKCDTAWMSILHDDDYLTPNFVESMMAVSEGIPGCPLYFGHSPQVDDQERQFPFWKELLKEPWRRVPLAELYVGTPFSFAGQLFRTDVVRALGSFRATSQYTGDWEMWAKLLAHSGAAETRDHVACTRAHLGFDRGSNMVRRSGRIPVLTNVQRKRVLALLRQQGVFMKLERRRDQGWVPIASRDLLDGAATMSRRLLAYNLALLKLAPSPNWRHAAFKRLAAAFGPGFVRITSKLWNACRNLFARKTSLPSGSIGVGVR
jgi:glycosyltransferase involved in cell wall biosynthesis